MLVFIGYDRREDAAYQVTLASLLACAAQEVDVRPIIEAQCRGLGLYTRPHELREGRLWCPISGAPMATQFAVTRFLVPALAPKGTRWALFCDGDFLFRADVAELFALADPRFAVQVVKHDHRPQARRKMDGQVQTVYARKNWSSLVLWNLAHPAHARLTRWAVNAWPGRDLHAFKWLQDDEIGDLPAAWNWLEGEAPLPVPPKAVHFTRGTPDMIGDAHPRYSAEWWSYLR